MNYSKLKYSNQKITDFDFNKSKTLNGSIPDIDVEKMWAQKYKTTENFIPSLKGELDKYGKMTNKEINNILRNKKMQINKNLIN